jgi:cysteine synthase
MSGNTGHFVEMIAEIKLKLCLFVPTKISAIDRQLMKRFGVPDGISTRVTALKEPGQRVID